MSEEQENDFIEESLRLAPEPYRTIIRRRLDEGIIGAQLTQIEERYALTEEQIDTITLMAFRAACDPDVIDSLKDGLIAEADLSYEVAIKIQRDIVRNILLPIKEEGDAVTGRAPTSAVVPARTETEVLFSDPKARVTARNVTIGGATYAASALTRYVGPFLVPHFGFIGDIFQWGDWYVALHFSNGEERHLYWPTRDQAGQFAAAIHRVIA